MIGRMVGVALWLSGLLLPGCARPTAHVAVDIGHQANSKGVSAQPNGAGDASADAASGSSKSFDYELREIGEDWPSGEPMIREQVKGYADGTEVRHGLYTAYWENGQEKLQMYYVDGVAHGPKQTWHIDGTIWSQGAFVNGKEDGPWVSWYPTGTKQQEFHMRNGALHGQQTSWYPNEQKQSDGRWVNGKQVGYFTIWDVDGNIVREINYGPAKP